MIYEDRRIFTMALIDVVNSNPNGDPDRGGAPRRNDFTGCGEISDVSFVRKIRDMAHNKKCEAMKRLVEKLSLEKDINRFNILESKENLMRELKRHSDDEILDKYWDVRCHGTTLLFEEKKAKGTKNGNGEEGDADSQENDISEQLRDRFTTSGVIRPHIGTSICPVNLTNMTLTQVRAREDGKGQGIAPDGLKVVNHGLYVLTGFVNPNYAYKTKCTRQDVDAWLALAPYAYFLNHSFVRSDCHIVKFWALEHNSLFGSFSERMAKSLLMPVRKDGKIDEPSRSLDDYDIPEELPKNFKGVKSIRDLVVDPYVDLR